MKIQTKKKTLARNLIIMTLAVSLIPLIALAYFAVSRSKVALEEVLREELKNKTVLVADDIDRFFLQRVRSADKPSGGRE